jgi:hypothetical protein
MSQWFTASEAVGSLGVALLLGAFFANLCGFLDRGHRTYQSLNLVGAGLACWASWMIGFFPFVILEGAWAIVAAVALTSGLRPDRH